eukprot:m.16243 g.16243  ORF g.16243 m.16243 type:complete len:265 (-) comp3367_c0_seq2:248-1042(-)
MMGRRRDHERRRARVTRAHLPSSFILLGLSVLLVSCPLARTSPTPAPSVAPSNTPTVQPTAPTDAPTDAPTETPSAASTATPTAPTAPTPAPSLAPTLSPVTAPPTANQQATRNPWLNDMPSDVQDALVYAIFGGGLFFVTIGVGIWKGAICTKRHRRIDKAKRRRKRAKRKAQAGAETPSPKRLNRNNKKITPIHVFSPPSTKDGVESVEGDDHESANSDFVKWDRLDSIESGEYDPLGTTWAQRTRAADMYSAPSDAPSCGT